MSFYIADIVNPFSVTLGQVYIQYYHFLDPIIAFILFLSISQWVFTRVYKGKEDKPAKEAKMIAVAVSLALTFGFAMLELTTGFYFGSTMMQGLAGFVLLLVLAILLYELLLSMMGTDNARCAAAWTYFIMYGVFMSTYSPLYTNVQQYYPLLGAILGIGFIISLIGVIMCLVKLIGGGGGGGQGPPGPPGPAGPQGPQGPGTTPPGPTPTPLRVSIRIPPRNTVFNVGDNIPLAADVTGGTPPIVWYVHIDRSHMYGSGPNALPAQITLNTLRDPMLQRLLIPGDHIIGVRAVDSNGEANAEVKITIRQRPVPPGPTPPGPVPPGPTPPGPVPPGPIPPGPTPPPGPRPPRTGVIDGMGVDANGQHIEDAKYYLVDMRDQQQAIAEARTFGDRNGKKALFVFNDAPLNINLAVIGIYNNAYGFQTRETIPIRLTEANPVAHDILVVFPFSKTQQTIRIQGEVVDEQDRRITTPIRVVLHAPGDSTRAPLESTKGDKLDIETRDGTFFFIDVATGRKYEMYAVSQTRGEILNKQEDRVIDLTTLPIVLPSEVRIKIVMKTLLLGPGEKEQPAPVKPEQQTTEVPAAIVIKPSKKFCTSDPERKGNIWFGVHVNKLQDENTVTFDINRVGGKTSMYYRYHVAFLTRVAGATRLLTKNEISRLGIVISGMKTAKGSSTTDIKVTDITSADDGFVIYETEAVPSSAVTTKTLSVSFGTEGKLANQSPFNLLAVPPNVPEWIQIMVDATLLTGKRKDAPPVMVNGQAVMAKAILQIQSSEQQATPQAEPEQAAVVQPPTQAAQSKDTLVIIPPSGGKDKNALLGPNQFPFTMRYTLDRTAGPVSVEETVSVFAIASKKNNFEEPIPKSEWSDLGITYRKNKPNPNPQFTEQSIVVNIGAGKPATWSLFNALNESDGVRIVVEAVMMRSGAVVAPPFKTELLITKP